MHTSNAYIKYKCTCTQKMHGMSAPLIQNAERTVKTSTATATTLSETEFPSVYFAKLADEVGVKFNVRDDYICNNWP